MRLIRALALLGTFAALVLATGCATTAGLSLDEVTSEPIAVVYWDATTARKRQELLDELEGQRQEQSSRVGVARLDAVADLVGVGGGQDAGVRLRQYPGRIVLLNARTGEIMPFTAAPPNARPLAWSPDRSGLLFNSTHQDGGKAQLFEYHVERGELRKLTHGPAHHLEGDYGPDGRLLVSWLQIERGRQLAGLDIRPPGGGIAERLLDGVYPSTPQWSPRGDSLIYVQADNRDTRRDRSRIVLQAPAPGAEIDVLARGREAVYTPDGEAIVYAAETTQGWELQRMRADGSGRVAIGRSPRDERWPAVSPDGRHVVYVANDGVYDRLYIRRIDGSGDRILLEDGAAAFPVW